MSMYYGSVIGICIPHKGHLAINGVIFICGFTVATCALVGYIRLNSPDISQANLKFFKHMHSREKFNKIWPFDKFQEHILAQVPPFPDIHCRSESSSFCNQ